MNKIEELLEEIKDNLNAKEIVSDFCWKLAWDASEVEIGQDFEEWFHDYMNPKPTTEKIKVTISSLKQFNWNSVYDLTGIDYNGFDELHIVKLDKETFHKLFK